MAALYTIVSPDDGIDGDRFAIAADSTTAHYVFPSPEAAYMTDGRLKLILQMTGGVVPTTPEGWINLAVTNLTYVGCDTPISAPTLAAATVAAQSALAEQP